MNASPHDGLLWRSNFRFVGTNRAIVVFIVIEKPSVFFWGMELWRINNKTPNVSVGISVYVVFDIHAVAATIQFWICRMYEHELWSLVAHCQGELLRVSAGDWAGWFRFMTYARGNLKRYEFDIILLSQLTQKTKFSIFDIIDEFTATQKNLGK